MINHYIDLHEYINENIYRLPVKENQIITEAINWGGVIKNTLIGGGIIALILLILNAICGNKPGSSSGGGGGSAPSVSFFTFDISHNKDIYRKVHLIFKKMNDYKKSDETKYQKLLNLFNTDEVNAKLNSFTKQIQYIIE